MTIDHFKQTLQQRRQELQNFVADQKADSKPIELDQQSVGRLSRMDAMQMQAMAQEIEQRRKNELLRIDAALERIATEGYGYC